MNEKPPELNRRTDKDFFSRDMGENPFLSFENKAEVKPAPVEVKPASPKDKVALDEQNHTFLPFFFIELIHRIRNTLSFIKTFTHLSKDKLDNPEFKEYFYKMIDQDVNEIDSVLNSLITYFKIVTPIVKANTVHSTLDEILKKYEHPIDDRKIKIIKKFEKDLPETIVHEEQLRYIFNSVVEYAIPLTFAGGSIGFLTKSFSTEKELGDSKSPVLKDGRYVEIVVIFTGSKKPAEKVEAVLGTAAKSKEEEIDLKLLLVKEIIRKNQGTMRFEVDEKKPRTILSMVFPAERRKIIHYQLDNL